MFDLRVRCCVQHGPNLALCKDFVDFPSLRIVLVFQHVVHVRDVGGVRVVPRLVHDQVVVR
eukprot:3679352-Rhodomonas_salina.1